MELRTHVRFEGCSSVCSIGRDLDLLASVVGLEERVRRIIVAERRQPNGGMFELLVAAAYRRAGARLPSGLSSRWSRTHDIDVELDGQEFAVECKRMETGAYGERERARMRELWAPALQLAQSSGQSVFGSIDFLVPLVEVPDRYIFEMCSSWISSRLPSMLWSDHISRGAIGELDLAPLRKVLETDDVLIAGTRLHELLSGRYIRHANYLQVTKHRQGMSPRYMTACEMAILLRWQSLAPTAIAAKARDVFQKLADANDQLPHDKPGIVHIGFEAIEGDNVERERYGKILESTAAFDPRGKPLRFVFCHYFVPESPPDQAWAFEETVQWRRITGLDERAPYIPFLVLPPGEGERSGPHWQNS